MKNIKLIKKYFSNLRGSTSDNVYYFWAERGDNPKMETSINFLMTEVGNFIDWHYNFALDPKSKSLSGNAFFLDKENNNIIIDDMLHDSEEDHEDRAAMPKDDFLKLLNDWQKVYSQKPDEIIITQDENGKISITGKFTDGREI